MSLLYTNKIPHPANFAFAGARDPLEIRALGGDVYRISSRRGRGWRNPSQAKLARRIEGANAFTPRARRDGTLEVRDAAGAVVFSGQPGATLGRSGEGWMLQFRLERDMQFYGLGEHSRGFDKRGQRVKFWNTDAIGDYYFDQIKHDHADPMFVSIPWVIVKRGNFYVGLLVHHPGEVYMDLGSNFIWAAGNNSDRDRCTFYVGAPDGQPELFLIVGPDLPALVRKLQTLVGRTPLPPRWSLGYHQCRWGYRGPRDLRWLDREFRKRGIPCDGLWLDIDYMEDYKVFTFSRREWGGAAGVRRSLRELRQRGRRVVAILDPGVKVERGYSVHDDGLRRRLFCLNPTGEPFVGFAWPGHILLPDYSRADVRRWWREHVKEFARTGMGGAWIDMNDPAVGAVLLDAMRFNHGREPHASYHNQYALGMAEATRAGFLDARPNERPFILSRSACTSSSRHTAVWTGDNFSNWHHLRLAVSLGLGLGLSGLPFNGSDVGGFAINATRDLMIAWYKASFLFPFFRNHSAHQMFVRPQEPWRFGRTAERIMGHYVRLRYKLLPYLYQLFIAQEERGDAILRPLFHDFADTRQLPLGAIADEFLVGSALLQAPVVEEGKPGRNVVLPGRNAWYSLADGKWERGGRKIKARAGEADTPLYVRDGSIVPMRAGNPSDATTDLREVELHVFLSPNFRGEAEAEYSADDGETFDYQRGRRTTVRLRARRDRTGVLRLTVESQQSGFGPLQVRVFDYSGATQLRLETAGTTRSLSLRPAPWRATGVRLQPRATSWLSL